MIKVTLYSRADCHLCEQAHTDLLALQAEIPHELQIVDVDSTEALRRSYGFEVPVVEVGPYRLKAPFDQMQLRMTLGAARDRQDNLDEIAAFRADPNSGLSLDWTSADRFTDWLAHHYLAVFNLFVIIYLGLPVLAPVLMKVGLVGPARLIYRGYSFMCHQLSYRTFFLFGEQLVYPRQAAGVTGLQSYEAVTGLSSSAQAEDLLAARQFIGNEQIGYKIALCERDVMIYGGILNFGIIFAVLGRRIRPLPLYLLLLIGVVPIAVDGLSQLLSQPPLAFLPFRESTPFLRSLTGWLFGFTIAWFGYPYVEESMREAREILDVKKTRIAKSRAIVQHGD